MPETAFMLNAKNPGSPQQQAAEQGIQERTGEVQAPQSPVQPGGSQVTQLMSQLQDAILAEGPDSPAVQSAVEQFVIFLQELAKQAGPVAPQGQAPVGPAPQPTPGGPPPPQPVV